MDIITYLIYFGAGVLQDIAITIYYRLLNEKHAFSVAVASFLVTVINLVILYSIISTLNPKESIALILVFSLGNAAGAYFAVKYYPNKK